MDEQGARSAQLFMTELMEQGAKRADAWKAEDKERIRERAAAFVNAAPEQTAMVPNTSYAFTAVVQALKGIHSKVLVVENEYPSLTLPLEANQFITARVRVPKGGLRMADVKQAAMDHRAEVLVISHVQWLTGEAIDPIEIGRFCKKNGILFMLDVTQSIGAIPLDFPAINADVMVCSNYKWMNAGLGTGLLWLSNSFMRDFPPVIAGFGSCEWDDEGWHYEPSIRSYEPGHENMAGLLALEGAMKTKQALGMELIREKNLELSDAFRDGLTSIQCDALAPSEFEFRSSIVCIPEQEGLFSHLDRHQIQCARRDGYIRFGFHYHNTKEEVQQTLSAIKGFTR